MRKLFCLLLATCFLAGSAGNADAAHWTVHAVPAAGFSLATPSAWLDASVPAASRALERIGAKYPLLAAALQLARASDLVELVCLAPGGYPNLSVGETASPGISLPELVAANVHAARKLPFVIGRVSSAPLRLPAGRAELIRYEVGLAGEVVEEIQYVLLRRGRATVLSYSARPPLDAATRALVGESADSFRYLR